MLSIGNPLRLLTTVSKEAGHPHPCWKFTRTHSPAQTCCNQTLLPVSFFYSMSEELHLSHPTQTPQVRCPKTCKSLSIKLGVSKVREGGTWVDPMGRCVGSACGLLRAHLQMWDPQRGFPRDLNKGEIWSVNKRWTLVLVPCIHKGKSSDLASHLQRHFPALPRAVFGASLYAMVGTLGKPMCQHWH